MKKIIISIALVAFTSAFAQKKEITAAFKAIEAGSLSDANNQIAAAESALGGKFELLEPSLLEQYYYTKGVSLIKSGKTSEGASYLMKINELGKSKIYSGKDSSKNKVFYVGKSAADASGISGLKEETYTPTTSQKLALLINPILIKANNEAIDAYNAKNYAAAATKFKNSYDLLKAVGQQNGQLLYNAALSHINAKNNSEAITLLKELIATGYTGQETTYTAKNKATGKVENFEKSVWDVIKKSADYTDFKTETSKSIEAEIYETTASLLVDSQKYDEAIAFLENATKKFPSNTKLSELQSHTYYKSGKTNEFVKSLKEQLAKNPNDAVNWYNLGVLQSKDPALKSEAINNYRKAIELNPKMNDAYQNLTYLLIGEDDKAIEEYNNLRKAGKIDQANKVLDARRTRFKEAIPVAEKWLEINPNNIEVVSLLKGLYQSTQNEAKMKEMKAKEDDLKGK